MPGIYASSSTVLYASFYSMIASDILQGGHADFTGVCHQPSNHIHKALDWSKELITEWQKLIHSANWKELEWSMVAEHNDEELADHSENKKGL